MIESRSDSETVPPSTESSDRTHPPRPHLAAEVATQPDDWAWAAAVAAEHRTLLPSPGERVAVVGCGTSYFMACAIAELRESAGHGLTDAWPASAVRGGRDYDRYLVICRSGTTTEVVDAMRAMPATVARTVICSSPGTPVLELADPILIDAVDERSVVQTRFATTALAILRWHLGRIWRRRSNRLARSWTRPPSRACRPPSATRSRSLSWEWVSPRRWPRRRG